MESNNLKTKNNISTKIWNSHLIRKSQPINSLSHKLSRNEKGDRKQNPFPYQSDGSAEQVMKNKTQTLSP